MRRPDPPGCGFFATLAWCLISGDCRTVKMGLSLALSPLENRPKEVVRIRRMCFGMPEPVAIPDLHIGFDGAGNRTRSCIVHYGTT